MTAKKLKRNGHITRNSASGYWSTFRSASGYWSTFRGLLKILYRNGLIRNNVNDFLEKIETEDVVKDYLSVEELYKLAETPCKKPVLKTASLFSCMTSLRISDILALCWEDIVDYSAGGKCVHPSAGKTSWTIRPVASAYTSSPRRTAPRTSSPSARKLWTLSATAPTSGEWYSRGYSVVGPRLT